MRTLNGVKLYARLIGYVRPYLAVFCLAIVGMVISAATEVALPMAIKPFLDGTFIDKNPVLIQYTPLALIGIFFFRGVGHFTSQYASAWVGNKVVMDLRKQMFSRMLKLPLTFFHENLTGNTISRFTYDVSQVTQAATQVLTVLIKDSLSILGLLAYLLYLDWRLTLISFAMFPPIALVVHFFNVKLRQTSQSTQGAMGDLTQVVQETIDCNKVIKIFGGQNYEQRRFEEVSDVLRKWIMRQTMAAAGNVPVVQMVAAIVTAIVVYYVTIQAQQDTTTVGGFVSFLAAMLMLTAPLKRITGVAEHLQRGLAAAESVFALLDEKMEPDRGRLALPKDTPGALVFENVQFTYSGTSIPALEDISIALSPGEMLALVGTSGGGKTTFANMVARFYQPDKGKILFDGIDSKLLSLTSLRSNVALVTQEIALFNDTVAANIAYGAQKSFDMERIKLAAEAANALEFIATLPDGFKTIIGENGFRLSGGQQQRLAIARAIFKNAPVLILDEATSSLDSDSEKRVQAALDALMVGRTTIVIAHRLSTIEKATKIAVLEKGRIVEVGTQTELLALGGVYSRLHRLQQFS